MAFDKKKAIEERRAKLTKNPNTVYWNWTLTGEEDCERNKVIEYRFLMTNQDSRTIHGVYSRIVEYLENIREETKLLQGQYQAKDGKNYHILLIKLNAIKGPKDNFPSNIYTRVNRDRKLTDHQDDESLRQYAKGKLEDLLGVEIA